MLLRELMQVAAHVGMERLKSPERPNSFAMAGPFEGEELVYFPLHASSKREAQHHLTSELERLHMECCVILMFSWITSSIPKSPAHAYQLDRLARGKIKIEDMPAEFREEILYLVGENVHGQQADRSWRVIREADGVRFEIMNDDAAHMDTPWRPMFKANIEQAREAQSFARAVEMRERRN